MKRLYRFAALFVVAGLALQLYFVGRIALMLVINPESTAFQRSQALAIAIDKSGLTAPPP